MATRRDMLVRTLLVLAVAAAAGAIGFFAGEHRKQPARLLQPGEQLADTATVLVAVRALARLESAEYHMERVVDLKQRQDLLFGLVHADDAILLIASGDVTAGVDLAKLRDGDITVEPRARRVQMRIPPPEILSVRIDNNRTYVQARKTDLLAQRNEQIESRARQIAESSIRQAALDTGILERARSSATQTLTVLARSLDYDRVDLVWSER
jgi:hypothetical protein